jgi:hypothetical protein
VLWQSQKRCCEDAHKLLSNNRIFYKSCYQAIEHTYRDEQLVVLCLWLMGAGADGNQRQELLRYLLDNFPNHNNRTDNCANCKRADTVARATLEFAHYKNQAQAKTAAIERLEQLLDRRSEEISYWVQAEIYDYLADLYLIEGVTPVRLERYSQALNKLNEAKQSNEALAKRFTPLERKYQALLAPQDKNKQSPSRPKPKGE